MPRSVNGTASDGREHALRRRLRRRLAERAPRRVDEPGLRPAAVLVPLVADGADEPRLLLTRRSASLARQPGHIAFPGGTIDETDPTPLAAALREAEEEIGLRPGDVDILGAMDERASVTGFRICPFVGWIDGPYPFRTNEEVEEILLVPLSALREPSALRVERREYAGRPVAVYHFDYRGTDIWGITGRIVKELVDLAGDEKA